MQLGGRDLTKVVKAVTDRRHYIAAVNMVRRYERPVEMFRRYLTNTGEYPCTVRVRTPQSMLELTLYSPHDLLTVNEIFCRNDYPADVSDRVIVDFGSNIGISAAFFLTRNDTAFTYLFEPLPANIARLHENLREFKGRYQLQEVAVGTEDGDVVFGWEESGRYGGVNNTELGNTLTVPCVNSLTVLKNVIAEHGRIDVLKIDIEGLEGAVVDNIPVDVARKIKKIFVEGIFESNPLAQTHALVRYQDIAQFTLLDSRTA